MLRACAKGATGNAEPLTAAEDRVLRHAFGRYGGGGEARAAAAPIVAHYQQQGGGCWLLCDCRPDATRPPALVPVAQTHIRRHQDERWPAHSETCDFFRDPGEQRVVTESYSRAAAARPLRLARGFAAVAPALERAIVPSSNGVRRPGLARLLMRLATDAGLQRISPGWTCPPLLDQAMALWEAARRIEIDAGVRLPEFLCTNRARLGELEQKILAAGAERFPRTRPHGVLIVRVSAVADEALVPVAGDPIPVRGRIAVFGEASIERRASEAERARRPPYLAACVIGRAAPDGPVEALTAYVHPCAGGAHLMLVDSNLERLTLAQLRSVQTWLAARRGVRVWIDKPLFDLGPEAAGADAARAPVIPDFVLRVENAPTRGAAVVAVETMGYADADYRSTKARVHPAMTAALLGAPMLLHDFHEPAGKSQAWRDARFWRELRWTITGPETPAARPAGWRASAPADRGRPSPQRPSG
jgi:hypothetical protein